MTEELGRRLGQDRALVDGWLKAALQVPGVPARLGRAMRYALLGPGKRLRPILCLETFRACGGRNDEWVRPFCCGIEMVHAFSLVHDDLPAMDDDDFRRSRPSLHRRYDEATAILAGDALFALAFELFARGPAPAARRARAVAALARAAGPAGMAGGQVLDLAAGRRDLGRVHRLKTAVFMAAALEIGALVAGAREVKVMAVREAGLGLGMLFQLTDDLLDTESDEGGRASVAIARGRGRARRDAGRLAGEAAKLFRNLGPRFAVLAGLPGLVLERER